LLNAFFVLLVLISVLVAAFTGRMEAVSQGALDSARKAVDLALGLVGAMTLFMGLMKVAQDAGLLRLITRVTAPVLKRLFPDVPPDHPAMSAMVLSIGSNILGLANAATPFGIRAMQELDRLNPVKGTATNAMVLFLAITTSGLAILPTGVVALRAAAGSHDPAGIFFTTWVGSGCATVVAIVAATLLGKLPAYRATDPQQSGAAAVADAAPSPGDLVAPSEEPARTPPRFGAWLAWGYVGALGIALLVHFARETGSASWGTVTRGVLSFWMIPLLVAGLVLFGWARGVKVYESLVEGAKEGFQVALRIIPYLVAILVAVGMFRASGCLEAFVAAVAPLTAPLGLPAEAVPVAVLRPLSGSGAFAVVSEILTAHGPDSYLGYLVSTMQGSADTTFYILAVYFGAVGIKKTRHAVPAGLLADIAGIAAAVFICRLVFG
jgi:spore maturation protein SpmA